MKKFLLNKKDVLAGVARWGILQSPYYRPENLEIVIDKLNDIIDPLFIEKDEYGEWLRLTYDELKEFIFKHTTKIPEFEAWNVAKKEGGDGTSSRYHKPKQDYDFIDLHALARNVANDIIRNMHEVSIPLILKENDSPSGVS